MSVGIVLLSQGHDGLKIELKAIGIERLAQIGYQQQFVLTFCELRIIRQINMNTIAATFFSRITCHICVREQIGGDGFTTVENHQANTDADLKWTIVPDKTIILYGVDQTAGDIKRIFQGAFL